MLVIKQQIVLPLTGSRSVLDERRCCRVHPAGSPWRMTGSGPTSSRRQQEQSPDGRSPPPSTSPETGAGGPLLQKQNLTEYTATTTGVGLNGSDSN